MFEWFLAHFEQALFVDDDVLVSPYAPDLFRKVPCAKLGAVVEAYHKQVRVRVRVWVIMRVWFGVRVRVGVGLRIVWVRIRVRCWQYLLGT